MRSVSVLLRLARLLWPRTTRAQRLSVAASALCLAGSKVAALTVPWLFGRGVDAVAGAPAGPVFAVVAGLLGAYVAMRLIQQLLSELKTLLFISVAQRQIRHLAREVFAHLHRLPLSFHLDRRTGGLARAIDRGAKSIEFMLSSVIYNFLPTLVELVAMCAIFWGLFGWDYAAAVAVSIGFYIAFSLAVTAWRIQYRRKMNESDEQAGAHAVDSLLNHETVKMFNAEKREERLYDDALSVYESAAITSNRTLSALNAGQALMLAAGLGVVLLFAARDTAAGNMTPGELAAVNAYLMQLFLPLNFLGTVYRMIVQAVTDMERFFALLDEPLGMVEKPGARPLPDGRGRIVFDGVALELGGRKILNDVSFVIEPGTRRGLVGATGQGKSTVTRLLGRLIDPDDGRVLIDGADVRDAEIGSVRGAIGYVPQDTVMFNATLRTNLAYGDPGANAGRLDGALAAAGLAEFVAALPDGLETMVGERGLKLSGGERQRLAIARALLKRPRIFVFDEATSALDVPTEKLVKKQMMRVTEGSTALIIAHRLATVMDCDRIMLLDGGRIVEEGTHEQLLLAGGRYHDAWVMQSRQRRMQGGGEGEEQLAAQSA